LQDSLGAQNGEAIAAEEKNTQGGRHDDVRMGVTLTQTANCNQLGTNYTLRQSSLAGRCLDKLVQLHGHRGFLCRMFSNEPDLQPANTHAHGRTTKLPYSDQALLRLLGTDDNDIVVAKQNGLSHPARYRPVDNVRVSVQAMLLEALLNLQCIICTCR
jgi:hypothetical protein